MVLMILIEIRVRHGSAGDDILAAFGGGGGGSSSESAMVGGMVEDREQDREE